jgi:hypothetical protein
MTRHITGTERRQLAEHLAGRYEDGDSILTIAVHTDRSYSFTRQLLREAGVTLRPPGGRHASTPAPGATP